MMLFRPLGLDHVVLRVRDQAASQRFYTDVLGGVVDHVNEKVSLIQLRFGEHLIDLLPLRSPAGPAPSAAAGGMDHFCLSIECPDLGKVADELRRRGVALEGDVVQRRGAFGHGDSLYIRDPDGYLVELKPRSLD